MDFDTVEKERENLVLFEETMGSSFGHFIMEGSSYPHPNLFHSPFYDPFDPFQTLQYPTSNFAEETISPKGYSQQLENKSCLILDNNNAKRKRDDSKKMEAVQKRRRKIIDKKSHIIKGQWTSDEDRLLEKLVEKHGVRKWSSIAQMLPGRIGKQCRERWHNHLKPNIKKDRWSDEEDRILIEAHKQVGNRWAEIARSMPGRSENTIKNHWNATKRRQLSSRKNNINKYSNNISPLQDYIKKVIINNSSTDHLDSSSSSSSSSAAAAGSTSISPPSKKLAAIINAATTTTTTTTTNHEAHDDQSLIGGMQFDFDQLKEMDFMEMLSIGYI